MTLQIGFLASHNGSAMKAIMQAIDEQRLDARAAVLISNNPDAAALQTAQWNDIPAYCMNVRTAGSQSALDQQIVQTLQAHGVELVILSGYMKKIGRPVLDAYPDRILNVHPSLLPEFGGPGMYGLHVHAAVLEAGVEETGATIHIVDDKYDHGRILTQARIPILPGDTPELLRTRVAAEEGELYIQVIEKIIRGDYPLETKMVK